MSYVKATYNVTGTKNLVEGAPHRLPGLCHVLNRTMHLEEECVLVTRDPADTTVSTDNLARLINTVDLGLNAAKADYVAIRDDVTQQHGVYAAQRYVENLTTCLKELQRAYDVARSLKIEKYRMVKLTLTATKPVTA